MGTFYIRWAASTFFGTLYQEKYCPEWDDAVNRLIDKHWSDAKLDDYTVTLGGVEIWISNAFYSYGYHWRMHADPQFRPSVRIMGRLDSLVRHIKAKRHDKYVEAMRNICP